LCLWEREINPFRVPNKENKLKLLKSLVVLLGHKKFIFATLQNMNNNPAFNNSLISRWFNIEQIFLDNLNHRARLKTYRNVLDLANGLFAWDGTDAELISPNDAWPDQVATDFPTIKIYFVKPKYSYE
jgi:hypothetical protein